MKQTNSLFSLLVASLVVVAVVGTFVRSTAQVPVVTKSDGHVSPNRAKITFPDGSTQNVMVVQGDGDTFKFTNDDPITSARVRLWIDTIREIRDVTDNDALFVLKDGSDRRLKGQFGHGSSIRVARQDGSQEDISLNKLDKVEFLKAPRMDKQGRAMFDQWVYSPYTGEKLDKAE